MVSVMELRSSGRVAQAFPLKDMEEVDAIRLNEDDIEMIRSEVKEIKRISPEFSKRGLAVRVGEKINRPNITGIIPEYNIMRNIWPEPGGRWLNELDLDTKTSRCFSR